MLFTDRQVSIVSAPVVDAPDRSCKAILGGLAAGAPTGLQVIGYVRGVDVSRNTVDVEVD